MMKKILVLYGTFRDIFQIPFPCVDIILRCFLGSTLLVQLRLQNRNPFLILAWKQQLVNYWKIHNIYYNM